MYNFGVGPRFAYVSASARPQNIYIPCIYFVALRNLLIYRVPQGPTPKLYITILLTISVPINKQSLSLSAYVSLSLSLSHPCHNIQNA
jgi:hypothetical protein